jgi:16S rRNA (guanine527-N7)-methyltransferase
MTRFHQKHLPPNLNSFAQVLRVADLKLQKTQIDQLWAFHNLLRNRNHDRDLTRITGFEPMIVKHYIDSMIVGKFFPIPSPVVDVGTGAGFPGIPLKIRYPHLRIILAEPRPRRIAFLKEAIHLLKLKNIEVFEHKVTSQSFTTPVKAVVTRALEEIDKTMLRTSAALQTGGHLIFLKGPAVDPEIKEAKKRLGDSFVLVMDQTYKLPHMGHTRRLIVYKKIKNLPHKAE